MTMKTINASSNGADFIRDINDNFNECIGSGNGTIAIKVPMQGGELKTSTGYVDGRWCTGSAAPYTWTDDNFYKYLHTPCYLSLKGNSVKEQPIVPSGSSLSIFCYDDMFTLMDGGVVNAVANIPDSTTYIKFQLYNANGFTQVIALDLTLAAEPTWVKNTGTAYAPQFFNFDCHPPKLWDDANYTVPHTSPTDGTADIELTRYHDNGYVMLPPNYSPTGTPCKVVMWFGGDGNGQFIKHIGAVEGSAYDKSYKYLLNNGFAVVSFGGYTSMWKNEVGATDTSNWMMRLTPASKASMMAFYDRIMANYNFDPAVYLISKSAGGSRMLHAACERPFHIRAAAGMSTIISVIDIIRCSVANTNKSWHKMFGCPNWNSFSLSNVHGKTGTKIYNGTGATSTQTTNADLVIANKDKYRSLEPFTMGSDIDFDAFVAQQLAFAQPFNDGADYPTALTDVIFAAHKDCKTPLKYWCATQDANTPYTWHKILADWITKCGGICELRTYSGENYNSHGSFDGSDLAVASAPTQYGGTMTDVPLGFVEAVEWFKRW